MRELLGSITHPSHYAGIEDGICRKNPHNCRLHLALAFPDLYEVGMSYLGQKILYDCVNQHEGWYAERVMAPEKATGELLRKRGIPLATLETDTPLAALDCIGFSITHELCYTNVLYMLDLAHIPLTHEERAGTEAPLIIAGGGALFGAEPLAPFVDCMLLGDGEEIFPRMLELLERAKDSHATHNELLDWLSELPGVYVPSFFTEEHGRLTATKAGYRPTRTVVADLNTIPYPVRQVVPIGAVHNRLSFEIARGCTRGCRFCQAGIVYRPVRERSVANVTESAARALTQTGFDELSFLALSAGDYSAVKELSHTVLSLCKKEQISFSLPSQRVGSIDESILARMADIRRTGMTLAPEAGSQRLRDVINKGITEEELVRHVKTLVAYGWNHVKLYFMIGLPTETDDDLAAIVALCSKVRSESQKLQVTAAISPFVPKPFTPFQWARQDAIEEISRKIGLLRTLLRRKKGITLRWHEPAMSALEGLLSRAGREVAPVVAYAYRHGAIFCNWMEHFTLDPWLQGFQAAGIDPTTLLAERDPNEALPWDHLEVGVSTAFLREEWNKAQAAITTSDCRFDRCHGCGVCDTKSPSRLHTKESPRIQNRLCRPTRDQDEPSPHEREQGPNPTQTLTNKAVQYRLWHTKCGGAAFVSQLELQSMLLRALRRARVPVAFSNGFHPMPLISFGRALPVGVESLAEWFALTLSEAWDIPHLQNALTPYLPQGITLTEVEEVDKKSRTLLARQEDYLLFAAKDLDTLTQCLTAFLEQEHAYAVLPAKKGPKTVDIRPYLAAVQREDTNLRLTFSWEGGYTSPITILRRILELPDETELPFRVRKESQILGRVYP